MAVPLFVADYSSSSHSDVSVDKREHFLVRDAVEYQKNNSELNQDGAYYTSGKIVTSATPVNSLSEMLRLIKERGRLCSPTEPEKQFSLNIQCSSCKGSLEKFNSPEKRFLCR